MAQATGLIATKGIELLTFGTPNGLWVAILLEELKAAYNKPYTVQTIDIMKGVQRVPWYTALHPAGKIPVIIDHDRNDFVVFEGPAIMNYLTRMHDPEQKFSFSETFEASTAEQWMNWQHSSLAPLQSQANFFYRMSPVRHPFPTFRFVGESEKTYAILDKRLQGRDYIAGSERGRYSIVDIAMFSYVDAMNACGIDIEKYNNVKKWWERVGAREAVKKGMMVPSGEAPRLGYAKLQAMKKDDPKGWEEREGPLQRALQDARKQFGGS
ncbi:glutathione S-transferase [Phaeosphaeria sp. MPI-PUGE-AT-0046c]|nr:glutathione S-transferase [Phaeosphaeria sp. MPI-PUGE-AT-0046c]